VIHSNLTSRPLCLGGDWIADLFQVRLTSTRFFIFYTRHEDAHRKLVEPWVIHSNLTSRPLRLGGDWIADLFQVRLTSTRFFIFSY
jgi:hypothetical protein